MTACPHLPVPRAGIDWRHLNAHRHAERGARFYADCLEYGHALWLQGRAGRAILCLDRAFGAELSAGEPILAEWPLPYAAMAWILGHADEKSFAGNPRVHFQHYADRMNPPRVLQRRWRAWACWALTRSILPHLPDDPRHAVTEPPTEEIERQLRVHGLAGEAELWLQALAKTAR